MLDDSPELRWAVVGVTGFILAFALFRCLCWVVEACIVFDPTVTPVAVPGDGSAMFTPLPEPPTSACNDELLPVCSPCPASPLLGVRGNSSDRHDPSLPSFLPSTASVFASAASGYLHVRTIAGEGSGLCLIAHGNNGNIDVFHADYDAISRRFRRTVVFDYRGYGSSRDGLELRWGCLGSLLFRWWKLSERTVTTDFLCVWSHLRAAYPTECITVVGYSLGGGISVSSLAQLPRGDLPYIKRLILLATFTSVLDVAAERVGCWARLTMRNRFDSERHLLDLACPFPVSIVAAETDDKFKDPMGMAARLSRSVYNSGSLEECRLLCPPGSTHGNVLEILDEWWEAAVAVGV